MNYCKEHILYTDTWDDSSDCIKCKDCHFKAVLPWNRRVYCVFLDGVLIEMKKFEPVPICSKTIDIPKRLTRLSYGYPISHKNLLNYIHLNKIIRPKK